MIKGYTNKFPVIDHSFQASIYASRYTFQFNQFRSEPGVLSDTKDWKEYKSDNTSYFAPADIPAFLTQLTREQINDSIKESTTDFPAYAQNLVKFGHCTKAYAERAILRRSEFCFLNGAAIPRDEVMHFLDDASTEESHTVFDEQVNLASIPTKEFTVEDGKKFELDVQRIREITGFSYSPYISHRKQHIFIPWKKRFMESKAKLLLPITCRQAGKTHDSAEICVEESFKPDQNILIVSISVQATNNLMKYFRKHIRKFGDEVFHENKQSRTFTNLLTRSEIQFAPAGTIEHAENLRGKTVDLLIIDEAWLFKDGIWDEILKPTLIVREGRCIMLTTMRKERNWFFNLLAEVKRGEHKDAETFSVPYWDNPFYPDSEMEAIRQKEHLPHVQREYLCRYSSGDGNIFDVKEALPESTNLDGCVYVLGYDPARIHDRSGITLLAVKRDGMATATVSIAMPEKYKKDWYKQRDFIKSLIASLKAPVKIIMDVTGVGDGVCAIMENGGVKIDLKVRYTAGNSVSQELNECRVGKSYLVNLFIDNCDAGEFTAFLPTCADLMEEVGFAIPKKTNSGSQTFESPFFDDVINSAMLSVFGWRQLRVRATFDTQQSNDILITRKRHTGASNIF